MKRTLLLMLILALALSAAACAKKTTTPAAGSGEAAWAIYDANGDAKISREEFLARWKNKDKGLKAFLQTDRDGNGFVERVETNSQPFDVWNEVDSESDF